MSPLGVRRDDGLSGPQKSAVLCLALGAERAAQLLQHLSPAEVARVSREMAALPQVGPEVIERVLVEFREAAEVARASAEGGEDVARHFFEQALGAERARSVLDRAREGVPGARLRQLRRAGAELIAGVLRGEHPQTIAVVLARLEPREAAGLIAALDADLAADVLVRLARMERIAPEMIALVESGLSGKADFSLSEDMTPAGGAAAVAKLLNLASPDLGGALMTAIAGRHAELAGEIEQLRFVFEDLLLVDGKGIQRLLRDVETRELALALKGASPELRQHVRANMSERAAGALEEEMEMLGPVRVKDVEAAHARIIDALRQLEQAGEVTLRTLEGSDDYIS